MRGGSYGLLRPQDRVNVSKAPIAIAPNVGDAGIFTKGLPPNCKLNLTDMQFRLQALKSHKDVFIHELLTQPQGHPVADNFRYCEEFIGGQYPTECYPLLHDLIRSEWKDVAAKHDIIPGTVGAFFTGCIAKVSGFNDNPGCTPICAGSVRHPRDTDGCKYCTTLVLLYIRRGQNTPGDMPFMFLSLNRPESPKKAYIFVSQQSGFTGFTPDDKTTLKGMGVEEAKVVRYTQDGRGYKGSDGPYVPVDGLPLIHSVHSRALTAAGSGATATLPVTQAQIVSNGPLIAIIVIFAVLIIFIIVAFIASRSSMAKAALVVPATPVIV